MLKESEFPVNLEDVNAESMSIFLCMEVMILNVFVNILSDCIMPKLGNALSALNALALHPSGRVLVV